MLWTEQTSEINRYHLNHIETPFGSLNTERYESIVIKKLMWMSRKLRFIFKFYSLWFDFKLETQTNLNWLHSAGILFIEMCLVAKARSRSRPDFYFIQVVFGRLFRCFQQTIIFNFTFISVFHSFIHSFMHTFKHRYNCTSISHSFIHSFIDFHSVRFPRTSDAQICCI